MTKQIDSGHLSVELQKLLKTYDTELKEAIEEAGEESINFCNEQITKNAKDQSGSRSWAKDFSWMKKEAGDWSDYIKHFAVTKKKTKGATEYIWHVKAPKYRLTHLLERSHQLFLFGRPHGMTKAYPHIEPAVNKTEQHYLTELEDKITQAGYKTEE